MAIRESLVGRRSAVTFRTRLLVIFTLAVVASVGLVELLVSNSTRQAFEGLETQRVDALVAQFQKEFDRRKEEIVLAVNGIARSEMLSTIATSADFSSYYDVAPDLASAHGLKLLELVAGDGTIISSAEWPARFGYSEEWLTHATDWHSLGAFLKREELADGVALSLVAVSTVEVGDRRLYVVGGQELDREFLSTLVLPKGMRVLLYRNLDPQFTPAALVGDSRFGDAGLVQPLVLRVLGDRRETTRILGRGADAETFHALPLSGYEDSLLVVLLIASSRRELVELEASLQSTGIWVAAGGMLMGVLLAWWATVRITRPVQRLAESAGRVAAGEWGTTVEVASADEIGRLARAFNRMTHELVEQRQRLVQAERVAAWRELARRLAHELKNPLFPLQITVENMQRAREKYPEQFDEVFREGTSTLLAELSNLKQIIGRFSDFAKMPAPEMQPVDFNQLVSETLRLFEGQLAQAHVAAKLDLARDLRPVPADAEQMTRVLRNLILNAIDAMPQGGALTVRTSSLGAGIRLEVSDTGQGLTPEECERLFTPYYTTKTHGTGLGLAIVQSVVSDHKGHISVESEPGKGAKFQIDLGG
jgi:signal transduction histidine kinase